MCDVMIRKRTIIGGRILYLKWKIIKMENKVIYIMHRDIGMIIFCKVHMKLIREVKKGLLTSYIGYCGINVYMF